MHLCIYLFSMKTSLRRFYAEIGYCTVREEDDPWTTFPSIPGGSLKGESSTLNRSDDVTYSMAALSIARRLVKSYSCVKCIDKNVHSRLQTTTRMFCVSAASRSSKY